MNLKQLRAFREVMLTGSVSEAARNLHRTQPAISALIAGLEDNIGLDLFERKAGRLHPVPEAHYLLEEARAIIDRLQSADSTMKSIRDLEQGIIRMVSMPGPSVFLIPELISNFVTGRRRVKVSLQTRSSAQVQQLMAVQQYDVGLADIGVFGGVDEHLVNHDVYSFECVCAMPANDPLAEKDTITAADLAGRPLAALYEDHPHFASVKSAFEEMGADLNVRFETMYFMPLFTYVERSLAYSIVDPLSARSYELYCGDDPKIQFRPFTPKVHLNASVITPVHRPLSRLVLAFVGQLKTELKAIETAYASGTDASPV